MPAIINPQIEASWRDALADEFTKDYFVELKRFLTEERAKFTVFPPGPLIFSAFNHTPLSRVSVVILGQDPYHDSGQAHGLCFSVPDGIVKPPSLVNILKELKADLGFAIPTTGNLEKWADQGVLLLNATLTVRAHQAGSHQRKGWEIFTDAVIRAISDRGRDVVFLLWGAYAQAKAELIDRRAHHILMAPHPSPLAASRGFFGCSHFSKTNQFLLSRNKQAIDWNLSAP